MKSTNLSLIAGTVALAAVTGFAALSAPGDAGATGATAAARLPVERSSLLCPAPGLSELAETAYSSFTPASAAGGEAGTAELKPSVPTNADAGDSTTAKKDSKKKAADSDKPVVSLKEPGKPATADASGSDAPALVGTATGKLAPGWTTQQTTTVSTGASAACSGSAAPDPTRTSGSRPPVPRSPARTTSISPTRTTPPPSPTSSCTGRTARSSPMWARASRSPPGPASRS